MSPEKSAGRLLFIDGDTQLLETLRRHFEAEGYTVCLAASGQAGLELAANERPSLILLAAGLPDMAGLDAFRHLRAKPRTGHIPVIVAAGRSEAGLQNQVLEQGAYDFIEKPLDLDILTLRVRNALRRAEREGLTEPRTGLPTGRLIQERLAKLAHETGWYRIDVTIDSFDVFRDLYGFVTANEALRFAGNLIAQLVSEHGNPDDFVGHPNGSEEFILITSQARGPALSRALGQRVSQELESFYNFMEREQGYVWVEDGSGRPVQKPLMSAHLHVSAGPGERGAPPSAAGDDWVDAQDENGKPESPFSW